MPINNIVHVAVAVIQNSAGQYFIAKRSDKVHQGGLWEFPGGKVEKGETVLDALERELYEEVGITQVQTTPLIQIQHDYDDKSVLLDVFIINSFSGKAFGKEGQETRWIKQDEFILYDFPCANTPIINAIQLPDKYMITGKFNSTDDLLSRAVASIKNGIKLIQFRAPNSADDIYFDNARKLFMLCEKEKVTLLLNCSVDSYKKYTADKFSHGLHLTSKALSHFHIENFQKELLISTSTHNQSEISLAEEKNVSFIVLSPVNETQTHPDATPLGWGKFKQLTKDAVTPIFALGGMREKDLDVAKNNGAQGIAAIGEFWNA